MPAERCRVGVIFSGVPQFYVRDTEQKRDGRWVALPLFDPNLAQALVMSEATAKAFVTKLQSLGVQNTWIEDCKDGRRIESTSESTSQSGEDSRTAMVATLDDENSTAARWYVVKPICRPDGRKWFLKIIVPGLPDPYVTYADDPLATLQRAEDLGYLRFAEQYVRPQPQQAPATPRVGYRLRPGDVR
jgi:hypothetical protein